MVEKHLTWRGNFEVCGSQMSWAELSYELLGMGIHSFASSIVTPVESGFLQLRHSPAKPVQMQRACYTGGAEN